MSAHKSCEIYVCEGFDKEDVSALQLVIQTGRNAPKNSLPQSVRIIVIRHVYRFKAKVLRANLQQKCFLEIEMMNLGINWDDEGGDGDGDGDGDGSNQGHPGITRTLKRTRSQFGTISSRGGFMRLVSV